MPLVNVTPAGYRASDNPRHDYLTDDGAGTVPALVPTVIKPMGHDGLAQSRPIGTGGPGTVRAMTTPVVLPTFGTAGGRDSKAGQAPIIRIGE